MKTRIYISTAILMLISAVSFHLNSQSDTQRIVIRKHPKVIILRSETEKNTKLRDSVENLTITIQKFSKILSQMADSFAKELPDTTVFNMTDQSFSIFDTTLMPPLSQNHIEHNSIEFNIGPSWGEESHGKHRYERVVFEPEFSVGLMRNQDMGYGTKNTNGTYSNGFPELNAAKSLQVGIGPLWGYNLYKGKLRIWSGLKYYINNYRFRNPSVRISPDQPAFTYYHSDSSLSRKSKVVVNYLSIPLAIGYKSDRRKALSGFWFKAGVDAGVMVRSHAKTVVRNQKNKTSDDFNFNDIDLAPFAEIGYNSFGIYARMHNTNVFKTNEGPSGKQFNIGITMLF